MKDREAEAALLLEDEPALALCLFQARTGSLRRPSLRLHDGRLAGQYRGERTTPGPHSRSVPFQSRARRYVADGISRAEIRHRGTSQTARGNAWRRIRPAHD